MCLFTPAAHGINCFSTRRKEYFFFLAFAIKATGQIHNHGGDVLYQQE